MRYHLPGSKVEQDSDPAIQESRDVQQERSPALRECLSIQQERSPALRECMDVQQERSPALRECMDVQQERSPALRECLSIQQERSPALPRCLALSFIIIFICIHLYAQELPSISAESDTLDLSYWSQQLIDEDSWNKWMGTEKYTKPIIHSKILYGLSVRQPSFSYAQIASARYDNLNLGLGIYKPYTQKMDDKSWSFYTALKNTGYCSNLIIGDYRVNWGEGLLLAEKSQADFISPRNQIARSGFFRGAAVQSSIKMINILFMAGDDPLYANFDDDLFKNVFSTSSNPDYSYVNSGNKISGMALVGGSEHIQLGYLYFNQVFAYDFTDSLFQRRTQVGSATYQIKGGRLNFEGELANSGRLHSMIHSMNWGIGSFKQRIEYYQSDAFFPSWFQGNNLHTPKTFKSHTIQYQISSKLSSAWDANASFSYEKREVFGTNNISKQYLKLHFHDTKNSCLLSMQHRAQSSSIANDSTLVHETLPLDILRMQWNHELDSEWSVGLTVQDKYYLTNSGTKKHGFFLVNSFNWDSIKMKAQLQITMLQTKSSVYIRNDLGFDEDQWQIGDDLSYRLYVQITKKMPMKIVYKGSFWKRGIKQVQVEICF